MEKITAVIIVKNAEKEVEKCLQSLKNLVDDIVIVDDLSSDNTVEICKRYGAKVITHESKGNFCNQRNIGLENARGDWILQMDADEIIPKESVHKIIKALADSKDFAAFKLFRKNFFLGYALKSVGTDNYMIKIFRKGKGHYIGSTLHETLKIDGAIGEIEAEIYHYPFTSIRQALEKSNHYSSKESEEFLEDRNELDFREVRYRLGWKPIKLFWKLYVKKKGYKDGMYGFIWCILNVIFAMNRWLKIWEKALNEGKLKNYPKP
ncbi:MAG: glycosyltransferase family 2 protein [Candidatus Omnitrophica bacterium]|nr:glycosyltransferase family 2 protein [Candidatus Omnitrophota bacterium]